MLSGLKSACLPGRSSRRRASSSAWRSLSRRHRRNTHEKDTGASILHHGCRVVPASSSAATINASVAASLTDAFKEIVAIFTVIHPDVEVVPNYGASGALAKQIVQGAPADLFISANKQWLDYLLDAKVVDPGSVGILAANRLVFVGAKGVAVSLADLPKLKRIAIGSPKSVPAGQYAEGVLKEGRYLRSTCWLTADWCRPRMCARRWSMRIAGKSRGPSSTRPMLCWRSRR